MIDGMRPTDCPPTAPSGQTRTPNSAATSVFDPCPFSLALAAAFAHAKLDPTLKRVMWRLGADDVAALRGSEEFDPLDARPQHQPETDFDFSASNAAAGDQMGLSLNSCLRDLGLRRLYAQVLSVVVSLRPTLDVDSE